MSFLFPLYFLGAAALAVPILLHLRRRPPKEHMEFSSLMFLEKSPELLTRRTKIERWILLALRCLALLLLALIFCRPYFKSATFLDEIGAGKRVSILIDQSASMQREDLWKKAVDLAQEEIAKTGAEDSVSLAVFGEDLETVLPTDITETWSGSARREEITTLLADAKPGWAGTDLGSALAEIADETSAQSSEDAKAFRAREIVVISDFQDGAERDVLQQYAWPEDVRVRCLAVGPKKAGNLTANLVAAAVSANPDEAAATARRVRISNSPDSENEKYQLSWVGETDGKVVEGVLPPGASRVVPVPPRQSETKDAVLQISGDAHDFDNRVYVARTQPRLIRILFVGEDPRRNDVGSPFFYLARAMNRTKAIDPTVDAAKFEGLQAAELKQSNVLVISAGEETPDAAAKAIGKFAEDGGMVIVIADPGAKAETLSAITGVADLKIAEADVKNYAMLSGLDFDHPVLAPFAKAKVRDFTKIHTWKHRSLTLPESENESVKPIANFDSGDPAWIEFSRGKGRVFTFLSGWEPEESQLALSSKFVPLLYAMLAQAGYSATEAKPLYVGDSINLAGIRDAKAVKLPDGSSVQVNNGATVFSDTTQPGFYTVETATVGEERVFAVNLAPAESRIEPVDPAVSLADLGVTVDLEIEGDPEAAAALAGANAEEIEKQKQRLEAEEKENRQKIWKWLVLGILVILLIETWLAGRRKAGTEPTAVTA
ncbi:MAG: VWA domain-containing protein [Verrucomicrobiales bacterium]|nr:VWA domain-containing protein [Verrucomicrobiales bacterium]